MHTDLGMFFGLFFGIANGFSTFCSAKKTFDLIHLSGAYAAKELWRISARTVSISPYLSKENVDLNLEHYWILRWILPTNVWISPGTIWFNMVSVSTNIWISPFHRCDWHYGPKLGSPWHQKTAGIILDVLENLSISMAIYSDRRKIFHHVAGHLRLAIIWSCYIMLYPHPQINHYLCMSFVAQINMWILDLQGC